MREDLTEVTAVCRGPYGIPPPEQIINDCGERSRLLWVQWRIEAAG